MYLDFFPAFVFKILSMSIKNIESSAILQTSFHCKSNLSFFILAIYDRKMSPSLKKLRVFVSETIQSTLFLRSLKTNVQLSGCFLHFPHQPDSSPFYKKIIKIKVPVYQAHSPFNNLLKTSRNIFLVLLWGIVGNCVILQPE